MMKPIRLSIQFLILTLLVLAMVGTFVGSIVSSIVVSKNNLENNYLVENQYYAEKLAHATDDLFENMFHHLTNHSKDKILLSKDSKAINTKLNQLLQSNQYFNAITFVDQNGCIVGSAPNRYLEGIVLESPGVKASLSEKAPFLSEPYVGIRENLILLISVPVFDKEEYVGFLSGTIELHEDNILDVILGQHPKSENDSYVYVVDSKGSIIYHPNMDRINTNVIENKVVQEVLKGNNGHQEVVNSKGNTMLAGYAATAGNSNWGIISQTPKISVNEPIIQMVKKVSFTAIPFMIFIFLISFLLLKKIVNPIRKLAVYAQQVTEQKTIPTPHIPDWYFELKELKRGIFVAVDFYQKKLNDVENEAILDPLTGFYNRRTLESTIKRLDMYSIILFDIDHFKNANDKYGHQKGDEVLKFISSLVKKEIRETDLCYRLGGEEFLIVLPETNGPIAHSIAERIREAAATTMSPTGNPITLSMGVGNIPEIAQSFEELFHAADQALYEAKQLGRNRVKAAKTNLTD